MDKYYGWGLPIDISVDGWQIDRLIYIIHAFMAVLFVGWFLFFIYTIFRFRARPGHKADTHEKHFKLPTFLEIGVALFEVFLLCAFSIPLFYHTRMDLPAADKALNIRVVAEQFAWNIHYPGKDKVFGRTDAKLMNPSNPVGLDPDDPAGKDDITTINQLRIPINTPILATLSSKDVIHSFALPVMRVKQDAIPGHAVKMGFEAKQTGNFEIACAQLCGLGHYRMKGYFNVDEKDAFNTWYDEEIAKKLGTAAA